MCSCTMIRHRATMHYHHHRPHHVYMECGGPAGSGTWDGGLYVTSNGEIINGNFGFNSSAGVAGGVGGLGLENLEVPGGHVPGVTTTTTAVVPEPATWLLLFMGLIAMRLLATRPQAEKVKSPNSHS